MKPKLTFINGEWLCYCKMGAANGATKAEAYCNWVILQRRGL